MRGVFARGRQGPGLNADRAQARRVNVRLLAVVGGSALLAAVGVAGAANTWTSGGTSVYLGLTHSEDGATGTTYVQPTVPAASVNPTAQSIGSTITVTPDATLATSRATVAASLTSVPQCAASYCPSPALADDG
jgi:hypothetical protein